MYGFNELKILELNGTPYENGLEHGKKLKDWIYEAMERAEYYLIETSGRKISDINKEFQETTSHYATIEKYAPHLLDETRGISDGAEIDFDRLFAYQCNEEILLGMLLEHSKEINDEKCSSLGCARTTTSPAFVGQNLDWMNIYEGFNVLLKIKSEKSDLVSYINTQPGVLSANGMNNVPLAVCVNSLETDLNCSRDGMPLNYIVRVILEKQTLQGAVEFLTTIPHASAQNFVIGDISQVVDYECSANQTAQFIPNGNPSRVYHTNHPLINNDFRMPPFEYKNWRNTFTRFKYMQHRMDPSKPFTIDSAKMLFRSYFGPINVKNQGTNLGGMTFYSSIFELTEEPIMHLTLGAPSESKYQQYPLPKRNS